ncbi:MAG: polysaccharide deacetylase family protein, partial [Polyangiaceae bacterium]
HVSIHDVSPAWEAEIDLALEMCHAVGAKPALLIVPNFHGRAPLADAPHFAEKLRKLQQADHEIFLHGFFHRSGFGDSSQRTDAGSFEKFFAQKIVSAGEAEFSDVSRAEATKRLEDGEKVLKDAGLSIDGFIAPAWSMPKWLIPLLADRGTRFTEDHTHVYDPAGGRSRASLVLNYASRTPGRLLSSVAYCRIARPLRRVVPARVAIHPGDMHFNLLRYEVRSLLDWAKDDIVSRAQDLFV